MCDVSGRLALLESAVGELLRRLTRLEASGAGEGRGADRRRPLPLAERIRRTVNIVLAETGVSRETWGSSARTERVAWARMLAAYVLARELGLDRHTIAAAVHRSAASAAVYPRLCEDAAATDARKRAQLELVRRRVREHVA